MASSLFVKFIVVTALLLMMLGQIACRYQREGEDPFEELLRERKRRTVCPDEALPFYKNCKGNLQTCSPCLSDAERKCDALIESNRLHDEDDRPVGKNGGTCTACSTIAGKKCDKYKIMCGTKYDCGNDDEYRCENFDCIKVRAGQ